MKNKSIVSTVIVIGLLSIVSSTSFGVVQRSRVPRTSTELPMEVAAKVEAARETKRSNQSFKETLSQVDDAIAGVNDAENRAKKMAPGDRDLLLGYAAYQHGDWQAAFDLLTKAYSTVKPALQDRTIFYRAAAANRIKSFSIAYDLLNQFSSEFRNSPLHGDGELEMAIALMGLGKPIEAYSVIRSAKGVSPARSAEADRISIDALIEAGDDSRAISSAKRLLMDADGDAGIDAAGPIILKIKSRFGFDLRAWLDEPEQLYNLAELFADRSMWDDAARNIEKLLKYKGLESSTQARAKWILARSYRAMHRYGDSIALMEGLLDDSAAASWSDEIESLLATTYTKKGELQKAIALRTKILGDSDPSSHKAALMLHKIAFLNFDGKKYREAIEGWKRVLSVKGATARDRVLAKWYIAWCQYKLGQFGDAAASFAALSDSDSADGSLQDRADYWRGRSLEQAGRRGDAEALFRAIIASRGRIGYYQELAKRRLRGDKRDFKTIAILDPGISRTVLMSRPEKGYADVSCAGFERSRSLERVGLLSEAALDLRSYGEGTIGACPEGAMLLSSRVFAHEIGKRIASTRFKKYLDIYPSGSLENFVWQSSYPIAYLPAAQLLKGKFGVDPLLISSIMRQESGFDPDVVSRAQAVGLMQLMPVTANRLAVDNGVEPVARNDLYKPAVNLTYGVAYMAKLFKLFPDNAPAVIASYNAGEEAVGRWLEGRANEDAEEWIEEIPYSETLDYVRKVMVQYLAYQRIYRP